MSQVDHVGKPQRWDKPFGHQRMDADDVQRVLQLPLFKAIDADDFPNDLALADVIANDGRIVSYRRGDIIVRKGDYGNSLFVILKGSVRGFINQDGEEAVVHHKPLKKLSWYSSFSQLWRNSRIPEYLGEGGHRWTQSSGAGQGEGHPLGPRSSIAISIHTTDIQTSNASGLAPEQSASQEVFVPRIENVDGIVEKYQTFELAAPNMFGELSALARSPRNNTVFSDSEETVLLELRWQGLRDIRQWSDSVHRTIDKLYHERGLETRLRESSLFDNVDDETMKVIVEHSLFETYGNFDWTHNFQRERDSENQTDQVFEHEPIISEQDHYLDGLLLIHSGFARVSEKFDHGEKTIGYLTKDDVFGLNEIIDSLRNNGDRRLQRSLRAIGYVDVIRIPTLIVEEHLVPTLKQFSPQEPASVHVGETGFQQSMLDFLVDNRFINGTEAMAINTDRCVSCDDCVRACAAAHDDNPRFIRHGISHQNLTIANACMHCIDPVCLIGCPTGAIHRDIDTGSVIIDSVTCVGCATCANACPYNNIRMAEIRGRDGEFLSDADGQQIYKATKCDLCADQIGGPACQRACPHDALIRVDIKEVGNLSDWLGLSQ